MFNSRSDVILPHKKFTWTDSGGIYTHIPPRRYAPEIWPRYFMSVLTSTMIDLPVRRGSCGHCTPADSTSTCPGRGDLDGGILSQCSPGVRPGGEPGRRR